MGWQGWAASRHELDLKTIEDLTVTMIIGTITNVKTDYMARKQPMARG